MSSVLITLSLSGLYLSDIKTIEVLNLKATDIILGTEKSSESTIDVVIVAIDDASLEKYGQWPWPRNRIAQLLKIIKDMAAKSIGVDILFPEQDRASLNTKQQILNGYSSPNIYAPENIVSPPNHDILLANILADGPFVLGYKFLFDGSTITKCNLPPVSVIHKGTDELPSPQLNYYKAKGVICNYQLLSNAVSVSGFFNGTPDRDGILRRLPLLIEFKEQLYPSFALAVFQKFQNNDTLVLETNPNHITSLSLTDLHIPTDNQGNFLLGPVPPKHAKRISAVDILEGAADADILKDKIVLVGLTATGLTQVYQTPSTPVASLLDLHKYFIQALGANLHTTRVSFFTIYETVTALILSIVLAICIAHLPIIWSCGVGLMLTCASWVTIGAIYQHSGYLFSPLLPTVAIVLNCGVLIPQRLRHFNKQEKLKTEHALQLLKSSEASLQSVLNTIPDIVFRLDDKCKINFISPAISKYLNHPDHLLGRPIFELVAPEDLHKAQYRLNERRTGERATFDLEVRLLLSKDDADTIEDRRYFSISAEGIYQTNEPEEKTFVGTQGIIRDITKRKRLELQLLQAQKMEVIGSLAAGIAHDLNNILSGLVSYPDLLLLEIPKDSPLYKKVSLIQRSGKKAAVIVQDLLALARRNIIISDVCNLNVIISDYLASFEFQHLLAKYPNIVIKTDLQRELMDIKGSSAHLSKVIMNILHNAMEAMDAGGDIIISTTNTYVDTYLSGYESIPEGEYVCASITDSGAGINEVDLKRIFEPFYTRKSLGGSGTGLGMTVIWATVKDHKGFIDIESKEGHGTTLKIYLPTTREKADEVQPQPILDDYLGSETILIVDDIPEQLEIAHAMLIKLGYTVFTATSGEEAIEIIGKQVVDLVILDMIMPGGLDGLETYLGIIELNPNQKAIIASGYSESDRVIKLKELGVKNYIQKPYTMEAFGLSIRKELGTSKDFANSKSPH